MKTIIDKILARLLPHDSYGIVTKVTNGDTLKINLQPNLTIDLRLSNIDAPEKSQEFGKESKEFLERLVLNRYVRIKVDSKDRYNRNIGTVYLRFTNINKKMVENGYGYVYNAYLNDKEFVYLQNTAKDSKVGLWSMKNLIKPWIYRKNKGK